MKKRIMAAVVAAMMIVSMSVSVFAAQSPAPPAPKPILKPVPQKPWPKPTPAPQGTQVNNAPSDALITAMAAGIEENDISVGKVDKNVYTAFTKYIALKGIKGNIIATYTSVVPAGKTRVKCKSIMKGCQYVVLMQLVDGSVVSAEAKNVTNGSFTYEKPALPIVHYSIVNKTYY